MSPREGFDSGTEFALQALQGQIKAYTDNVGERMREFGGRFDKFSEKLDDHVLEERAWQSRMEAKVTQALAYGERIEKLEHAVGLHEKIYQKTQGAIWLTKIAWLVIGALASTIVWLYATFVEPKQHPPSYNPPAAQVSNSEKK